MRSWWSLQPLLLQSAVLAVLLVHAASGVVANTVAPPCSVVAWGLFGSSLSVMTALGATGAVAVACYSGGVGAAAAAGDFASKPSLLGARQQALHSSVASAVVASSVAPAVARARCC